MTKSVQQPNLLEGPLFKRMLLFILPLMLTNLLQMLYNAADMIIVGMSDVSGAIGAIGTTGAMINLILNTFIGFSVGANVVVARHIGAGEEEETSKAVHTAILVGLIFGFVGGALGFAVCRPMLILLGDEGHVLELATLYSRIYFAGAPFISLTNFFVAIFRAKGDSKTPLVVLSLSGLTNVLLNLFFVLVCHMSVDGVSLATVLSNVLSAVVLFSILRKEASWCHVSWKKFRICSRAFRKILYVGIPAGLQGALFSISNMLIQSSVTGINNRLYPGGSAVIDGSAASGNLENFAYTATNAVYQGAVTFTSQTYGAGNLPRVAKVRRNSYIITFLIASLCTVLILSCQDFLIGLYVDEAPAVETARLRIQIMMCLYFLLAFMEVGSGVLRGLGRSLTSTVVSLLGACVFRVVWIVFIFPLYPTLECIYWSYPISWILTATASFLCGEYVYRKELRKAAQSASV
jgi:putative MATE family efflux protein